MQKTQTNHNPATPAEQRIFILAQILYGHISCNPDAFKQNKWMVNKLKQISNDFEPIMNFINKRVPTHHVEGMLDEQYVTSRIITGICDTSHEQRVEILKALETAG